MKIFKSHFDYSKSQRNGIFLLIILIVIIQAFIYFYRFQTNDIVIENKETEQIEKQLDSLYVEPVKYVLKPFNPNYLSDYKAYQLGMSVEEIDRLFAFRKRNKYINSVADFKRVTKVSDSLLNRMSSYFKFPVWIAKSKEKKTNKTVLSIVVKDINKATFRDLIRIKGMNSKRVNTLLKYRALLQGFNFLSQLDEVWGIPKDVLRMLKSSFKVKSKPLIKRINVNKATVSELNRIVYIDYKQARSIVDYRIEVAEIQNLAELKTISNFPVDKFDLISLYLQAHQNN